MAIWLALVFIFNSDYICGVFNEISKLLNRAASVDPIWMYIVKLLRWLFLLIRPTVLSLKTSNSFQSSSFISAASSSRIYFIAR